MKYADLKKGETYFRYDKGSGDEGTATYVLAQYRVAMKGARMFERHRLGTGRLAGKALSRFRTTYSAQHESGLHATPADAKAALVNALTEQIKTTERKLTELTKELNEVLLYELKET